MKDCSRYKGLMSKCGNAKALRAVLLCAVLSGASLHAAYAQQANDDDEDQLVLAADEETLDGVIAGEEDTSASQLRTEPIGAVNARTPIVEDDPYAAEGIRLGKFIFRPSIEIGLTGTTTASNVEQAAPAGVIEQRTQTISNENALRLLINSDWSRHALEVELNGTVPVALSGDVDDPTYGAAANLRLDLSSSTVLTLGGEFSSRNEDPQSAAYQAATDPVLNPGITGTNEPATRLIAGTASLAHDFGGVTAEISAAIGRLEYSAARLNDGTSVTQSDLNSTTYDFALRGGYALSGVVSPFVEASYGMRVMDEALDGSGIDRNATRYGLRAGAVIDMGEKFNGEISAGYAAEKLADDRFDTINAFTLAAALNWSPVRGTDVAWNVSTEIQPSGLEDIAGSVAYATELGLTHRLRSNLTANASVTAELEDYAGPRANRVTLGAQAGLTYNINRFMAVTGRVSHEQVLSADETLRGSTTGAFVGVRLQR